MKSDSFEEFRNNIIDIAYENFKKMKNVEILKINDPNVPTLIKRTIRTGLPSFDIICARTPKGRCGLAPGRQIELFSKEAGAGKTTFAQCLAAACQKQLGWMVNWCEGEGVLDPNRAQKLGLDPNHTFFNQPECFEDLIDVIDKTCDQIPEKKDLPKEFAHYGAVIVVDSLASFPVKDEIISDNRKEHVGLMARKMSKAQRRITSKISKRNIIIIWVNQGRDKISMGPFAGRGGGINTYGGRALKFHVAQRWELIAIGKAANGRGMNVIISNKKNKCGVLPYQQATFLLDFQNGFDYVMSFTDALISLKMATKKGPSTTFKVGPWEGEKISSQKIRKMYVEQTHLEDFETYEKLIPQYIGNYSPPVKGKKNDGDSDTGETKNETEDTE